MSEILNALRAIQSETVPIEEHTDPGAIEDCFNVVREGIEKLKKSQLTPEQLKAIGGLIKVAKFYQKDAWCTRMLGCRDWVIEKDIEQLSDEQHLDWNTGGKFARSATPSIELLKQIPGVMDE